MLYNSHDDRSSTQYARYLVAVKLGRYLSEKEHVDHIDNDKTNDEVSNLQILTLAENNKKEGQRKGKEMVRLICPNCKNEFNRLKKNFGENRIHYCSKKCCYKLRGIIKNLDEISLSKLITSSFIEIYRDHT
jgi:hypothetical protein